MLTKKEVARLRREMPQVFEDAQPTDLDKWTVTKVIEEANAGRLPGVRVNTMFPRS